MRTLEGPGRRGMHRITWDLRIEPPYEVEERRGFFGAPSGPTVLPGDYRVQLLAGDRPMAGFRMRWDPRVQVGRQELEARWEAARSVYELVKPLHDATERADSLTSALEDAEKLLARADGPPETLTQELDSLMAVLEELDDELDEVNGDVRRLSYYLEASSHRPTEDQERMLNEAWQEAPGLIRRLNDLLTDRAPAFFDRLNEEGIRPALGAPLRVPTPPRY